MSENKTLDVVLCWHMHQPWYLVDDRFERPWVYLHALKDYADMAAHLEAQPAARAVVNFVPVLLEQIERYTAAIGAWTAHGTPLPDRLLAALARPLPEAAVERGMLVAACLDAAYAEALARHHAYARLVELARAQRAPGLERYLSDALLDDLIVWTHLVWFGEHDHRHEPTVQALVAKGGGFDARDRRVLFGLVAARLEGLLRRYRALADAGRIELSVSPWAHPLVPLLLDFGVARQALPEIALPDEGYPGGAERVRWHLSEALAAMERVFGRRPVGCWPPEAAISEQTLDVLGEFDFAWTASSGAVLSASLRAGQAHVDCVHRPFRRGNGPRVFFRDDGLSDLIGFVYKDRDATAAVTDLVGHLERIAAHCARDDPVVTIALDGENAWSHYRGNGYDFLSTLYRELSAHPRLRLTTFTEHLARGVRAAPLDNVIAGSWVYGTFSTWIGHPEKNRAWSLLVDAKRHVDAHGTGSPAERRLLAICEGSDWYWWLGDDNSTGAVATFDALFRAHLQALYRALGGAPPAVLESPLSRGSMAAIANTMRPTDARVLDVSEGR